MRPIRDPVKVNLLLRDFVKPAPPPRRWVRGKSRSKRALYISSPIGLGHARRGYRGVPGGEAPSSGIANGGGDGPKD
jgi:hypothetical protein